jgi:hypothetical protein
LSFELELTVDLEAESRAVQGRIAASVIDIPMDHGYHFKTAKPFIYETPTMSAETLLDNRLARILALFVFGVSGD